MCACDVILRGVMYARVCGCVRTCVRAFMHACMYVSVYVHVCVWVCVWMGDVGMHICACIYE